jgi:methionyl aminopeptidase
MSDGREFMTIETEEQLEGLRRIGKIVANCLQLMARSMEPGMTTRELDAIGRDYLAAHGAVSAPILSYNFPGTTCISVNNEIAHGPPSDRKLEARDLVNIDVSAEKDGYFADTGGSFIIPPESKVKKQLCAATQEALQEAMKVARAGQPLNRIGQAIENTAKKRQLSVIRNLGSHGTGAALHEEPKFIAPFLDPKDRRILRENMVITIEPFLSTGAQYAEDGKDGWTLLTHTRFLTAQFEHTLVIAKGAPIILTLADAV